MPDIYTTRQLVMVLEALDRPHSFLLDRFFGNIQNFDTEVIDFDIIDRRRKLAPFVSPMVQGKAQKDRGFTTKTFKPAYVKPKTQIDPNRPLKRRPGERYAGILAPAARRDAVITDIMSDHRADIIRRKEWMAAMALRDGKVIVEGDDYPRTEVDFGRDAELSVTLLTTDRWGETGVKVLDDIEEWAGLVQTKSGAKSTDVIMDPEAWKLARGDEQFLKLLDIRRQRSGDIELGPITVGGYNTVPVRYVGNVGDFDFFVYDDVYEDDEGEIQHLLPPYTVLLGGANIEGVQAHGAILDAHFGYMPLEFAPRNWIENDPPIEFVMTQSAPLVVPSRVNATFRATVHDGNFS